MQVRPLLPYSLSEMTGPSGAGRPCDRVIEPRPTGHPVWRTRHLVAVRAGGRSNRTRVSAHGLTRCFRGSPASSLRLQCSDEATFRVQRASSGPSLDRFCCAARNALLAYKSVPLLVPQRNPIEDRLNFELIKMREIISVHIGKYLYFVRPESVSYLLFRGDGFAVVPERSESIICVF